MQQSVIDAFPQAGVAIALVWIKMMDSDTEDAAHEAAALFDDARVRHYYDPAQSSGLAVAASLGCEGEVAWDSYLFYPAGKRWEDGPPAPADWAHQLEEFAWADRDHLHTGQDLVDALQAKMAAQIGSPAR